jgi:hypothetical protein
MYVNVLRLVSLAFPKLSQLAPRDGNDADRGVSVLSGKHALVFRLYRLRLEGLPRLLLLVGFSFLLSLSLLDLFVLFKFTPWPFYKRRDPPFT